MESFKLYRPPPEVGRRFFKTLAERGYGGKQGNIAQKEVETVRSYTHRLD